MRPRSRRLDRHAVSVALYLALGWIGLVALGPFTASLGEDTLVLLAVGGALYTAGVVFHLWQRLPYQNAIWHGFVLVAAGVHYAAVLDGGWLERSGHPNSVSSRAQRGTFGGR